MLEFYWAALLCRRRRYFSKYLTPAGLGIAAALIALCADSPAPNAAAQTERAANNGTLTVGYCLSEAGGPVAPVGQILTGQGIVGEDLLLTRVTGGMCENMLERAADDSAFERLVAAQNYIQEIKLVENAIRRAESENTGQKSGRSLASGAAPDRFVALSNVTAQYLNGEAPAGAGAAQYLDGDTPTEPDDAQYRDEEPPVEPERTVEPNKKVEPEKTSEPERTVEEERAPMVQAAAAALEASEEIAAEPGLSIAEKVKELEARLLEQGRSQSEAEEGARCGLETALLKAITDGLSPEDYIELAPDPLPMEMGYRDTITVELSVLAAPVRKAYQTLEQQYEEIADVSEAEGACLSFTKRMVAEVHPATFTIEEGRGAGPRSVVRDTTWSWKITANRKDENQLNWLVGHQLAHAQVEVKPRWISLQPPAIITVEETPPLQTVSSFTERNWQWLLPVGLVLAMAAAWLVRRLRERGQHQEGPGGGA